MKKIVFIAVILFFASALAINAQRATPRVTGRQATQQARISNGVQNGQLTMHETMRLERQQRCIEIEKRMAKADGTVTPGERRFLRREQNHASRDIRRQKMVGNNLEKNCYRQYFPDQCRGMSGMCLFF